MIRKFTYDGGLPSPNGPMCRWSDVEPLVEALDLANRRLGEMAHKVCSECESLRSEVENLKKRLTAFETGAPTPYTLKMMSGIVFDYDEQWKINDGDLDKGVEWLRRIAAIDEVKP